MIINKIKKVILDLIFPISCLGCGLEDTWLCATCLKKIPINEHLICPICHKKNNGSFCTKCSKSQSLDGLMVAAPYENNLIQDCIQTLKYKFIKELSSPLSEILARYLRTIDKKYKQPILTNYSQTVLTIVPLHTKRLRERNFNQAELIGQSIKNEFKFNYIPSLLTRQHYTQAQASLSRRDRLKNLNQAFSMPKSLDLSQKNVIIIDDVATTLTTLNECAKVLKQNGCLCVWGLVIARSG
ncbi:hypothetical protein KKF61_03335 [Patescibacteria group bacterium]|nr:hypothetical protein [Patescibacteria group bacterium]